MMRYGTRGDRGCKNSSTELPLLVGVIDTAEIAHLPPCLTVRKWVSSESDAVAEARGQVGAY